MKDEKKKHRGWVKNAVIVFLSIMLVLTFFSSTIMNASLPQVAVQTVQGGTINSQVRGTGTVTAVEVYEVRPEETRTVQSVLVTTGQEVSPGDTLVTFADAELNQEAIDSARTTLRDMETAYQKALISATSFDYIKEDTNITRLTQSLADAESERDALAVPDDEYDAARNTVLQAEAALADAKNAQKAAEQNVKTAQRTMESYTEGGGNIEAVKAARQSLEDRQAELTTARESVTAAENALQDARTNLQTVKKVYDAAYDALVDEAEQWIIDDYNRQHGWNVPEYDETESDNNSDDSNNTTDPGTDLPNTDDTNDENPDNMDNPDTDNPNTDNPDTDNPENPDTENPNTENPDTDNPDNPDNPDTQPETTDPDESGGQDNTISSDEYRANIATSGSGYIEPWKLLTDLQQRTLISQNLEDYLPAQAIRCSRNETKHSYLGVSHYEAYTKITEAENSIESAKSAVSDAEEAVKKAETAVSDAQTAYDTAYNEYNEANLEDDYYQACKNAYEDAQDDLEDAQENVTFAEEAVQDAQSALSELDTRKSSYKEAVQNVRSLQEQIEDAVQNLTLQQQSDSVTEQLEALDLASQREAINDQQALVWELESQGGDEDSIQAQVYGIVSSISVTAGGEATAGESILSIEVPDRGYELEFTVTLEQSRRVSVGSTAQLSTSYWWGNVDINATLVTIRTDPKAPQQNRILVFSVTGEDVESGTSLTLSVGAKNSAYEMLVPTSAVREDSNGSFVYVLDAKQTPVGNRYKARRVDVQTLDADDVNTAISGSLNSGDYVITTSTAPVENGTYVRLNES